MTTLLTALAGLVACGRDSQPLPSATPENRSNGQWKDFWQIQYLVPTGTHVEVIDSVLPGPGGLGGSPFGERPSVILSKPEPNSFFVEIIRTLEPVSLDDIKSGLLSNKVGSNMQGTQTEKGWDLSYDMTSPSSPDATGQAHIIYVDMAGAHFQCSYADVNCSDPTAAEAICRSMRPSTTR